MKKHVNPVRCRWNPCLPRVVGVYLLLSAPLLPAVTINWNGSGSDDKFENTDNWGGGVVPGAADEARIIGLFTADFDAATGTRTTFLRLDNGATFNMSGGTLNGTMNFALFGGSNGPSTLNMTDGVINVAMNESFGAGSIINMSGGSFTQTTQMRLRNGTLRDWNLSGDAVFSGVRYRVDGGIYGTHDFLLQDNASMTWTQMNELYTNPAGDSNYIKIRVEDNATFQVSTFRFIAEDTTASDNDRIDLVGGTMNLNNAIVDLDNDIQPTFQVGADAKLNLGDGATHNFSETIEVLGSLGAGPENRLYNVNITGGAGNLAFRDGATWDVAVNASPLASDLWTVSNLDLSGSPTVTVEFNVLGEGVILEDDVFTLLNYSSLTVDGGDFSSVNWLIKAGAGTRLSGGMIIDTGSSLQLTGLTAFAIPEPSSLMLLGLGVMVVRSRVIRRRA